MHKIRGNKWNRQVCKWIASLLTVALLINQNCFLVLAEESGEGGEKVCLCDTRCSADGVNESCPVCTAGYENCKGVETGENAGTGEEPENPDTGDGENPDTGTETTPEEPVPNAGTETENPDEGTDTAIGEETEDSDTGEDEGVNADADIDAVLDADDDVNTLLEGDETENVVEEDAVSPAAVGDTFSVGELKYKITDEINRQVEVMGLADGIYAFGALVIPSTANGYTVVGIGDRAFLDCFDLESITIPSSVKSIGGHAFFRCFKLNNTTLQLYR